MAKLKTYIMLPTESRKDSTIGYELKEIVRCQECRFGRKAYQLAGFVICTNRYSACHTSVIEDTFFCAKGEPKVGEQE